MNPKAKGERSEAAVLARLLKNGYAVALPFGNNQRYDLLVEDKDKFWKVQVKTGRIRKGAIEFNNFSTAGGRGKKRYTGQIDYFFIFVPETDKVYKVPIDGPKAKLWIHPVRKKKVIWAKDFEF